MKKIIITGGHLTPALAVLEVLQKSGWEAFWIGEKKAIEGTKTTTLEHQVIPKLKVPFFKISHTKFQRYSPLTSILNSWRILVGTIQSTKILLNIRPKAVLSFGSYVSFPVILAAQLLRIPIIIHEQTAAAGLTNKLTQFFAKKVAISFPSSQKYFSAKKTVLTGNPIRKSIFSIRANKDKKAKNKIPVLYITGGSRGSQTINRVVADILETLLKEFVIYHQTGQLDLEKFQKPKKNYFVASNYTPEEVNKIMLQADIIISRAGANTVLEIAACGMPAILIPLPFAQANEQTENAQTLARTGMAIIISQEKLEPNLLLEKVREIKTNIEQYKQHRDKAGKLVVEDAAERIVKLIEDVAKT